MRKINTMKKYNNTLKILLIRNLMVMVLFMAVNIVCSVPVFGAQNVTVVIDPGHGGPDTDEANLGACYNGIREKDINLVTALELKRELEKYKNITVYITRDKDKQLSLKERIDFAKKMSADVVVSVHHNASANHLFYGSEIFVPSKGEGYCTGYGLATCIMKNWVSDGSADKGIKTRIGKNGDYYGIIRHGASVGIPVIILEHGYIDNYHDVDRFNDAKDCQRMGELDARGIASYYGLKKNSAKNKIYPTVKVKKPSSVVKDDITGPVNAKLVVDYYNPSTGEVKYTLSASEPESRIMYYGAGIITTTSETGMTTPLLTDVYLWGEGKSVKGSLHVPSGYAGPIYAICYNNYNVESNMATANVKGQIGKK